jgi:hypothetical protein
VDFFPYITVFFYLYRTLSQGRVGTISHPLSTNATHLHRAESPPGTMWGICTGLLLHLVLICMHSWPSIFLSPRSLSPFLLTVCAFPSSSFPHSYFFLFSPLSLLPLGIWIAPRWERRGWAGATRGRRTARRSAGTGNDRRGVLARGDRERNFLDVVYWCCELLFTCFLWIRDCKSYLCLNEMRWDEWDVDESMIIEPICVVIGRMNEWDEMRKKKEKKKMKWKEKEKEKKRKEGERQRTGGDGNNICTGA